MRKGLVAKHFLSLEKFSWCANSILYTNLAMKKIMIKENLIPFSCLFVYSSNKITNLFWKRSNNTWRAKTNNILVP